MTIVSAGIINAADVTIIDSFEDGDLSEYGPDTADFNVVDESTLSFSAQDGSNVLECPSSTTFSAIFSTSGLDNYFGKGNTSHLYFRTDATSDDFFLRFGVSDNTNYYRAQLATDDFLRLTSVVNGSATTIDTTFGFGWEAGKWYRIEITWDDGSLGGSEDDITVDVYDTTDDSQVNTPASGNNSDHATADGVGFSVTSGTTSTFYADYWHLP